MMVYQLTHEAAQTFAQPPGDVFYAIQNQDLTPANHNTPGAFLSSKSLWGTPGTIGHQKLVRFNWGMVDLIVKETLLDLRPPKSILISQQPEAFLPYDRTERMPPIGDTASPDLQKAFADAYGTPPVTTRLRFDLEETQTGTAITLSITAEFVTKPGWFKRLRWRSRIPNEVKNIFARITAALHTA